jgi:UDP-N-acetylmuramoyl-L-alanyl-D-glutamate--2,6-diaminopimelate ligase
MFQKIKNIYHLLQAVLANIVYGFPSRNIKVIGVTGTDGKTTTTHLLYHLLTASGKSTSMISTVYGRVGSKEYDTGLHVTTPDPFAVQKMIYEAVLAGNEYFILETTSHAIDQNRVWGVRYEGVVVTNITHEHLDYHGTLEEYAQVKLSLIKDAYVAVLNGDDEVTQNVYRSLPTYLHRNVKLFGLHNKADYMYDFGALFPKLEQFNKYNYLAAYALCCELGLSGAELLQHFATYKLPSGRIDVVYDGDFKVIVDFAHTPNAIARILKSVREVHMQPGGRLIHVFGSAGLRDASKRPSMGKASAEFADYAYITEEDYRTENPLTIAHQIASGFQGYATSFQIEVNRETAIQKALAMAKKGDLVILTGKGHEKSLCRGKVEYPWSDVECVKRLLNLN